LHTHNAFLTVFLAFELLSGGGLVVFGEAGVESVLDTVEARGDDLFDLDGGVDVL
jgi:hypothetical protein